MGWVYLDDHFVDHPKIEAVGGDAGWLYVCGLSYARANDTGGMIPKNRVGRLSDRKKPILLALALVKVGLWHDAGDAYEIHDYGMWNAKAEKRRVQAKAAAQKRWDKERVEAEAIREQMRTHEPTDMREHVRSDAYMGMGTSPTPSPIPKPQSSSGLVSEEPPAAAAKGDDDHEEQIWKTWAEMDRDRLIAETGKYPHDDASWLASVAEKRRSRYWGEAVAEWASDPTLTVEQVIVRLEKREEPRRPQPLEGAAKAARANMERDRSCPDCAGSGWRDTAEGALPCDHQAMVP